MKKITLLLLALFLAGTAWAASSASFVSGPNEFGSGSGITSSTNLQSDVSAGIVSSGSLTSASFNSLAGMLPILTLSASGDGAAPIISNVKVDGSLIVNGDLVKSSGALTATVTDEPSGINQATSRVVIDGTATAFNALTGTSLYDAATGALTCAFSLGAGTHYLTIEARDISGNSTIVARTVAVDTGELKAANAFINPNPFNPANGPARLAYQLNGDADITLYMFNEINQLVWKRSYLSGVNGGKAGYNEISWDGTTDFNETAGNGAYFLRIVSGGRVIGKIKIAVLK